MGILTHFERDAGLEAALKDCTDNYDVGDAHARWPNNILARQTVVYGNGTIVLNGENVIFRVDSDELEHCQKWARTAEMLMSGVEVGMGSEASAEFRAFWMVNDAQANSQISENAIRQRFGGTIFPLASVQIEPISTNSAWFEAVEEDFAQSSEDDPENAEEYNALLQKWRALVAWFEAQNFKSTAFIGIGDVGKLWNLDKNQFPPGTEITGSCLPRLLLGLTERGSLCGLFGFSVQT